MTDNFIILGEFKAVTLVALDEEEQRHGLQYLAWPPPIMSFAFPTLEVRKFWMHETPSPLDLVFCQKGRIIAVASGEPFSKEFIGPDAPVDLVVELPQGTAKIAQVHVGQSALLQLGVQKLAKLLELRMKKALARL